MSASLHVSSHNGYLLPAGQGQLLSYSTWSTEASRLLSPSRHPCARCSPECLSGPVCPLCALSSCSSLRCPHCLRLRSLLPVWRKLPFLSMPMLPHFSLTEKLFGFVVHTDSSGEPRYENPPLSLKSLNPGENSEIQKERTVI